MTVALTGSCVLTAVIGLCTGRVDAVIAIGTSTKSTVGRTANRLTIETVAVHCSVVRTQVGCKPKTLQQSISYFSFNLVSILTSTANTSSDNVLRRGCNCQDRTAEETSAREKQLTAEWRSAGIWLTATVAWHQIVTNHLELSCITTRSCTRK